MKKINKINKVRHLAKKSNKKKQNTLTAHYQVDAKMFSIFYKPFILINSWPHYSVIKVFYLDFSEIILFTNSSAWAGYDTRSIF